MRGGMGNWFKQSANEHKYKDGIKRIFEKYRNRLSCTAFNYREVITSIESILCQPIKIQNGQDIDKISQLSKTWLKPLAEVYQTADLNDQHSLKYYQSWILSARVLKNVGDFFNQLAERRLPSSIQQKHNLKAVGEYLYQNQLRFVYGRQLLATNRDRYSSNSNYSSTDRVQQLYNWCQQHKCDMIVKVLQLLAALDMIVLSGEKNQTKIKNTFMDSLQNIKKTEQREMLLLNYSFSQLETLKEQLKNNQTYELQGMISKQLPNYMFYKNKKKIRKSMHLAELQQKFEDYQFLEHTHDYIQWMFPNHYGSSFNSSSNPLNYIEKQLFVQDKQLALELFYSTVLFFDFVGIRFDNNQELVIQKQWRLEDVILRCYHNHLRLMRILACLSVTGFRAIALKFIDFLDRHTQPGEILEQERREFKKSWQIYGEKQPSKAKEMCFLQKQDFPPTHQFWKQITQRISQLYNKGNCKPALKFSQNKEENKAEQDNLFQKKGQQKTEQKIEAVQKTQMLQQKMVDEKQQQKEQQQLSVQDAQKMRNQSEMAIAQQIAQKRAQFEQQI